VELTLIVGLSAGATAGGPCFGGGSGRNSASGRGMVSGVAHQLPSTVIDGHSAVYTYMHAKYVLTRNFNAIPRREYVMALRFYSSSVIPFLVQLVNKTVLGIAIPVSPAWRPYG